MTDDVSDTRFQDVLTTKELCERRPFLNAGTLRYQRSAGGGPPSFTVGKKVLYRLSDVDAWLDQQEAASRRGGAA